MQETIVVPSLVHQRNKTPTRKFVSPQIPENPILTTSTLHNGAPTHEDPLWDYVYREAVRTIGPLAQKVKDSKLGTVSSEDKTIHLYCTSEEALQLIQQYEFIFLESLKRFFPSLKEIKANTHSCKFNTVELTYP